MAGRNHFRAHERLPVQLAASIAVESRGFEAQGYLVDLGLGGAAIDVAGPLRLGEPVSLRIWARTPARVEAEVAWVGRTERGTLRAGLRFRPEHVDQIAEIVSVLDDALSR